MKFLKPKFWDNKNSVFSILLMPISILFHFLINFKISFINAKKFKIPIICVGNIYVGGTGKTPISLIITNELKIKKKNPVIIKKYYKDHNDEHQMIRKTVDSLILNKSREKAIEEAGGKVTVK